MAHNAIRGGGEAEEEETATSSFTEPSSSEVGEWSSSLSDDTSESDIGEDDTEMAGEEDHGQNRNTIRRHNKQIISNHTILSAIPSKNGTVKHRSVKPVASVAPKVRPKTPTKTPKTTKKKRTFKRRSGNHIHWMATASTRANQDRQRELEERLMSRVSKELIRKTCLSNGNGSRHIHEAGKCSWCSHIVPPGGTYVRLEQAWRESRGIGGRPSKTFGWLGGRRIRTAR